MSLAAQPTKRQVVTSAVEHSAVHRLCAHLVREGYRVDEIGVDREGRFDFAALEAALTPETALVSVMHANNETGVLFDVGRVCAVAERHGVAHVERVARR